MKPLFFETPAKFREWLEQNHERATELIVGFYKRGTGRPSMTWPESVDEALSFGWIDAVRKRIDDESYQIRFTRRKRGSTWSAINIRRVEELTKQGRMRPAGIRAFEQRTEAKSRIYAYENATELSPEYAKRLRANRKAWKFFEAQPPWYRRNTSHWVMAAKKEETRERRFAQLIAGSEAGERIRQLARSGRENEEQRAPRSSRTKSTRRPRK